MVKHISSIQRNRVRYEGEERKIVGLVTKEANTYQRDQVSAGEIHEL